MKKKLTAVALVVCMLAIMLVGASLAYFTDKDYAKNTMTVGNVSIVQHEKDKAGNAFVQNQTLVPAVDAREEDEAFIVDGFVSENYKNVIDKVITVENTGSEAAWVRTILAFETNKEYKAGTDEVLRDGKTIFDTYIGTVGSFELLNLPTVEIDGVEYVLAMKVYDEALEAKSEDEDTVTTSSPSLKQFFLSPDADNEVTTLFGSEYTILALSQAVQVQGFDTAEAAFEAAFPIEDETTIAGWFAEAAAAN